MSDGTEWKIVFEYIQDRSVPRRPYLNKVLDYSCDGSSGQFLFDGQEVFQRFPLPYEFDVTVSRRDIAPYTVIKLPDADAWDCRELYRVYECRTMRIRVESVEELQDTSEPWWEEEEQAYICLFPTSIQRVTFTVLTSEEDAVLADNAVLSRTYSVLVPRQMGPGETEEVELSDIQRFDEDSCSSGEIESIE
jgi:hypothetical protein